MNNEITNEQLQQLKTEAQEKGADGVNWSMDVGCMFILALIAKVESLAADAELNAAVERMQKAHAAANVPAKLPDYDGAFEYQAAVHALIKAAVAKEKA